MHENQGSVITSFIGKLPGCTMPLLLLFLDGVGLGENDPKKNPFTHTDMANLTNLLDGHRLHGGSAPYNGERASLLSLDASLGVAGLPQSATGQAVLLTGINVPKEIGYHYGPKPDPSVSEYLIDGRNIFSRLVQAGKRVALLNAYPPRYFHSVQAGRRLYSAIPLAVTAAGISLFTQDDLFHGRAVSADFTGQGWHDLLDIPETPILSPYAAGCRLAAVAQEYDFAMFEYWASDYAGHGQNMSRACELLETLDDVLGGLLEAWHDDQGLILITSDHGNLEDLSTRHHTLNPVPALVIGIPRARQDFVFGLSSLLDIAPAIVKYILTPPKL